MKILLIIVVFICCILIGLLIKKYYAKRKNFYYDLKIFCDDLINEISYKNEKLKIIVKNKLNLFNSEFFIVLESFLKLITNEIDKSNFKEKINNQLNFLNQDERNFIINFFLNLGGLTKDEELQRVSNIKKEVEKLKSETFEKDKKFSNLYFKLFIILGLVLVIFFI